MQNGIFHHRTVGPALAVLQHDLRHIRDQCLKPVQMDLRQGIADNDYKGKVRISLRTQTGQGESFEQLEARCHPLGRVKICSAIFDCVVFDLKTADRGVGKSAQAYDLHRVPSQ